MKVTFDYILFVFCIKLLFTIGCFGETEKHESIPKARVKWVRTFSQDKLSDEQSSLILSLGKELFVIGQSTYISQNDYHTKPWLWKVEENGNLSWQKPLYIPDLPDDKQPKFEKFFCLNVKNIFIAYENSPYGDNLCTIKFNENGEVIFIKKYALDSSFYFPWTAVDTKDGFLIVGSKGSNNEDGWILKFDPNGCESWQKTFDNKKNEKIMSAVVTNTGELFWAANSGSYDKFGHGPSNVWLVKCSSDGQVLTETVFAGRHPELAVSKDGGIAVVYNRADFPKQDICVIGFNDKLQKTWEIESLLKDQLGVGIFKIVADSHGFVIAGSQFGDPCLYKIDTNGNRLWEKKIDIPSSIRSVMTLEALLANNNIYYITGPAELKFKMAIDPNGQPIIDRTRDDSDILIARIEEYY